MTKLKISNELLLVIQLIQTKKAHELILSELGLNDDWYEKTRESFFHLPNSVISQSGLQKSNKCFDAICRFSLPAISIATQSPQCSFSY